MADKYASFQELQIGERRGVYRVLSRPRKATIAVAKVSLIAASS
jgi:hypothetical protein